MKEVFRKDSFLYSAIVLTAGAAALLYCFSEGISGNDFWWHIKAGEWICTHGAVPDTDIFSWYGTEQNLKWVAHEWLAEVVFWLLYRAFGEGGIYIFSIGGAALMTGLLTAGIWKYAADNCLVTAVYICQFCVISSLFFYGRPQIFAFFLLYGELYCLYRYMEKGKKRYLCLIPVITCLWSNLHGGSANLSYLLVAVVLLGGMKSWKIGRIYGTKWTAAQMRELSAALALSIGAVFLNPAGAEVFLYPYINMTDPVAMSVISEWAAPDAKRTGDIIIFFLPVFLLCFGMVFGGKKIRAQDALMMLLFLALFFRSIRFIIWFEIGAAFWAFPYMIPCRLKRMERIWEKALAVCMSLILTVCCGMGIRECWRTWKSGTMITRVLEENVLEMLRQDVPRRLFNDYNYGGALIYADIPVFIDERADLYAQDQTLADGISLLLMQQVGLNQKSAAFDPEEVIDRYGFDAFLIEAGRPIYSYLHSHQEQYEEVLFTGTAAYFRRR